MNVSGETLTERDNRRRAEGNAARRQRLTSPDPAVRALQEQVDADWRRAALKSPIEAA